MIETYWNGLTSTEKETFQRAVRRLLKNTFIVREKDEISKKYYYFATKHEKAINEYLSYMGFGIIVSDREFGVIRLINSDAESDNSKGVKSNRKAFTRFETILLCCLWSIYTDKVIKGSLKKIIEIPLLDLKLELEKYDVRDKLNGKLVFRDALDTFKLFNLISYTDYGREDCKIILYPSLLFALNEEEFRSFAKNIIEKTQVDEVADTIDYNQIDEREEDYDGDDE